MENQNLLFHIKSQDYFGTLATVLSLINQETEAPETTHEVLLKIQHDLIFLQENYIIVPKEKTE